MTALIGLDDPVNGLLESFSTMLRPPGPITVRQLLNHTSGMPDFGGALDKTGTPKQVVTTAVSMHRGLELVASLPWKPRIVGLFSYSNGNYMALGQLIEKLRAKPLGEVLTEGIFRPLGLEQTSFDAEDRGAPNNLRAYILVDEEAWMSPRPSIWWVPPQEVRFPRPKTSTTSIGVSSQAELLLPVSRRRNEGRNIRGVRPRAGPLARRMFLHRLPLRPQWQRLRLSHSVHGERWR